MDQDTRHDIGYWMSIFGFSVAVFGVLVHASTAGDPEALTVLGVTGFSVFVIGMELALRNHGHRRRTP